MRFFYGGIFCRRNSPWGVFQRRIFTFDFGRGKFLGEKSTDIGLFLN